MVARGPAQTWVLPSDLTAASLARRHVEAACAHLPADTLDVARLLVTELVSNAVRHGRGTVLLAVACAGRTVRVEVQDDSPDLPVMGGGGPLMESGAGLRLVAGLSSTWGTAERDDSQPGKRVWFVLL
jgi:anti-sigma regulatory factor (Ser/Thr protein kinase)